MPALAPTLSLALTGLFLVGAGPASAAGLVCPRAEQPAPDGLVQAIGRPGREAGSRQALRAAVARMRGEGIANGAIIDQAVAAYCPLVAGDDTLSPEEKRGALRSFAAGITTLVYDPAQDDRAIRVTVPLPSALSDQIDVAAARARESRETWILRALEARVAER